MYETPLEMKISTGGSNKVVVPVVTVLTTVTGFAVWYRVRMAGKGAAMAHCTMRRNVSIWIIVIVSDCKRLWI